MLRLARYARVSTDEQSSVEAQLDALIPLAARLGGTITATETDVLTGHNDARPGYQRILALARSRTIEGVLVFKLDRLGRNHVESIRAANELELLGVHVYSATEPTEDPFVRDLLLLLANRETRVMSDRIKLVHRAKAREGQWQSRPPTGYVIQTTGEPPHTFKSLAPDPLKAALVRQLFEAAATGQHSVRELQYLSHAIGLTTSSGKPLTRAHIHKLLTNPAYQGDVVYDRRANGKFEGRRARAAQEWTVVENAHPAIIDRATFAKVQAVFAQHRRIQGDPRKTRWFLTSLIFCASCGSRMYGSNAGRDNYSYTCSRHQSYGTCETRQVGGKFVDSYVRELLRQLVVTPEVRDTALAALHAVEKSRRAEAEAQRRQLLRSRRQHEARRKERADEYLARGLGVVAPDVFFALDAEQADAIAIIDRTLATLDEARPLDISAELAFLEAVDWEAFDDAAWREAAVYFIERVDVGKGERKGQPQIIVTWSQAARLIREIVLTMASHN